MGISSKSYRTEIIRPYNGRLRADSQELLGHWLRFKQAGDSQALSAIVKNYLPNVKFMALRLMKVRPGLFHDLSETLSIATIALYECVGSFQPEKSHDSIAGFHPYFWVWGQKKSIFVARRDRNDGSLAMPSKILGEKTRNNLFHNLARNPTPQEVAMALAGKIFDPNFYARPIPQTIHSSAGIEPDSGSNGGDPVDVLGNIPGRELSPDEALLQKEARQELKLRTMKGLDKREKKILRQIMNDEPMCHLGGELGVTRQRVDQIAKRMLKRLRMQSDVVDYFAAPSDLKAAA